MRNYEVVAAWLAGKPAKTKSLSTDGSRLWSYKLVIATKVRGRPVVFNHTSSEGRFVSVTTSKHVGLACAAVATHKV